jgi:hypothetical protein
MDFGGDLFRVIHSSRIPFMAKLSCLYSTLIHCLGKPYCGLTNGLLMISYARLKMQSSGKMF